jgi:hypothetical protein
MYLIGVVYFTFYARHRLVAAAPEELTARSAAATFEKSPD